MKSRIIASILFGTLLFVCSSFVPASAADEGYTVKTGYLTCHVSSGWGFIIGSSRKLNCTYTSNTGKTEYYTGSVSKFGADIGYLKSAVILWAVAAPTKELTDCALAGDYGGVTAGVSLGAGIGANVLVGGFKKSIALQPVSVEGQRGLNVAAGVAALNLHCEGTKAPGAAAE
jgi:hypothetical protein